MHNGYNNRRKSRPFAPYGFLIIELVVLAELSYIFTTMFGTEKLALLLVSVVFIFLLKNCFLRMFKVLDRDGHKYAH